MAEPRSPRPSPRGPPRQPLVPPDTRSSRMFSAEQTRMMMVSSHLRNSRITLPMGFSALGNCGSCSAALMGILPTIWKRRNCVTTSQNTWVSTGLCWLRWSP